MKVWIVSFTTGEYSDRQEFTDCCFVDETQAREYAESKNIDVHSYFDVTQVFDPKTYRHHSRTIKYPFGPITVFGQSTYPVISYDGDPADPFSVSGPYEVKE